MAKRWYIVHAYSNFEKKVADSIREQADQRGLQDLFEQILVPTEKVVEVRRGSEALFLLQRIRDESHRFAITYHRELRGKRMTRSVLDGIPGLGEKRKLRLVKELGGVRAVQAADLETLTALPWLPDPVAAAVHEALHSPT